MSTLYLENAVIEFELKSKSIQPQEILDRDLGILVSHERTIKLWMRVFGDDPAYKSYKTILENYEFEYCL
jgi:hypothetical protein